MEQPENPSDGVIVTVPSNEPGNDPQQDNNVHPAWNELLETLPSEFHSQVTPYLKNIDENANNKIQELHSQYDPYKFLVENEIDPESVEASLRFVEMFNDNPEEIIRKAIEHYGLDLGQGPDEDEDYSNDNDEDDNENDDPRFRQLTQQISELQGTLTAQQQETLESQAEEALEDYLDQLWDEFGPYDEEYVLALMSNEVPGDRAVKQFLGRFPNWQEQYIAEVEAQENTEGQAGNDNQQTQQTQQTTNDAPIVAGGGGTTGSGLPSTANKPGSLTSSQTEDLVEQLLRQRQQAG